MVVAPSPTQTPAQIALARLLQGNQRYVQQRALHPRQNRKTRLNVAESQHPFAIILGCADSRVAPEVVFDQGLGDLFVVRVAGNVVDQAVAGSIEFAASRMGVPLVVVLGHSHCGAVQAAAESLQHPTPLPVGVQSLINPIAPAVQQAQFDLRLAERLHVHNTVQRICRDEVLALLIQQGTLEAVGGIYHLHSGEVEIL